MAGVLGFFVLRNIVLITQRFLLRRQRRALRSSTNEKTSTTHFGPKPFLLRLSDQADTILLRPVNLPFVPRDWNYLRLLLVVLISAANIACCLVRIHLLNALKPGTNSRGRSFRLSLLLLRFLTKLEAVSLALSPVVVDVSLLQTFRYSTASLGGTTLSQLSLVNFPFPLSNPNSNSLASIFCCRHFLSGRSHDFRSFYSIEELTFLLPIAGTSILPHLDRRYHFSRKFHTHLCLPRSC